MFDEFEGYRIILGSFFRSNETMKVLGNPGIHARTLLAEEDSLADNSIYYVNLTMDAIKTHPVNPFLHDMFYHEKVNRDCILIIICKDTIPENEIKHILDIMAHFSGKEIQPRRNQRIKKLIRQRLHQQKTAHNPMI